MERGIIVGCDHNQEWLLLWWWHHYAQANNYPVLFVDFGMSQQAATWCRAHGELLSIAPSPVEQSFHHPYGVVWEWALGAHIWTSRAAWFKKPLALLASPFSISIWTDLDCQICGNLAPLFDHLQDADISLRRLRYEPYWHPKGITPYTSGVLVFRKGAPILEQFASLCATIKDEVPGDDNVLSLAIANHSPKIHELPPAYHWLYSEGEGDNILIRHYAGPVGKEILKETWNKALS